MPYSVSLTTGSTLNPDPQLGNFGQPEKKKGGGEGRAKILCDFLPRSCGFLQVSSHRRGEQLQMFDWHAEKHLEQKGSSL